MSMRLEEQNCPLRYFGFHLDQLVTLKAMRSEVWDQSTHAPPKTRPASTADERTSTLNLEILAWEGGRPVWPVPLDIRFPEGTEECDKVMEQKKDFLQKYPPVRTTTATSRAPVVQSHPRAGGQCDYTLDGHNERVGLAGSH